MWRLHRYYLKELAINAAITFLVMFALVLVSLIPQIIQRTQGGDLLDAAKMTLLFALDSFPHLLSVAFLIATVLTYSRASQDRELVALRAAGISPRVAMAPATLIGILLSVVCSVAMHYVIPEVYFNKFRVIAEVVRTAFTSLQLDTDRLKVADTGYVLTFRAHEGSEYRDCTIYCPPDRLPKDLKSPILRVERVSIPPIDQYSDNFVVLLQGVSEPVFGIRVGDVPIQIPLRDLAKEKRRADRDDDLRSDQLLSEVMRGVHAQPVGAVYTLFRRCCFALLPALLGPIGFCVAEFARERGRVMALVLALVPLAMFYLGEVFGARLLIATNNPWCAWLPVLLLLAVGTPVCWRQLRR